MQIGKKNNTRSGWKSLKELERSAETTQAEVRKPRIVNFDDYDIDVADDDDFDVEVDENDDFDIQETER